MTKKVEHTNKGHDRTTVVRNSRNTHLLDFFLGGGLHRCRLMSTFKLLISFGSQKFGIVHIPLVFGHMKRFLSFRACFLDNFHGAILPAMGETAKVVYNYFYFEAYCTVFRQFHAILDSVGAMEVRKREFGRKGWCTRFVDSG